MDLILTRTQTNPSGIFGQLTDTNNNIVAVTLEHAYIQDDGSWAPKIPKGTYICVKGQHQLANMKQPFETFEITNVPNHNNILIHMGNYDNDSEGCVLVGKTLVGNMITHSLETFLNFMQLEEGLDQFSLTVV